jgi:hypothetical protein
MRVGLENSVSCREVRFHCGIRMGLGNSRPLVNVRSVMIASALRGVALVVPVLILTGACTGSGEPNIHKTLPLPSLQSDDYTTTPSACSLLTTEIVAPIMAKRTLGEHHANCQWSDLAFFTNHHELFFYVRLEISRYSPTPIPDGATAAENARREYESDARVERGPEQHTVPGMGDEAIISRRSKVIAVDVLKRNLVLEMTCAYEDHGYTKRAAQTCLAIMRRSFTRLR